MKTAEQLAHAIDAGCMIAGPMPDHRIRCKAIRGMVEERDAAFVLEAAALRSRLKEAEGLLDEDRESFGSGCACVRAATPPYTCWNCRRDAFLSGSTRATVAFSEPVPSGPRFTLTSGQFVDFLVNVGLDRSVAQATVDALAVTPADSNGGGR